MNGTEWKLVDRFKEPSSWSALAAGFGMLGVGLPAGAMQAISLIGAGICVLLGVVLHEGGSKTVLLAATCGLAALSLTACGGGAQQTAIDLAQDAGAGIVRNLSAGDLQRLRDTCRAAAPAVQAATAPGAPAILQATAVYPYAFCQQLISGATGNADQSSLTWLPQVVAEVESAAQIAGYLLPALLPLL